MEESAVIASAKSGIFLTRDREFRRDVGLVRRLSLLRLLRSSIVTAALPWSSAGSKCARSVVDIVSPSIYRKPRERNYVAEAAAAAKVLPAQSHPLVVLYLLLRLNMR